MTTTPPTAPTPAVMPERLSVATERSRPSSRSERRRLRERDAGRLDFEFRLEEDETVADLEKPEFFGASADRLRVGDRIAVLGHACSFWTERIVVDKDEALQCVRTVALIGPIDLAPIAAAQPFNLSKVAVEEVAGGIWRLRLGNKIVANGFSSRRTRTKPWPIYAVGARQRRAKPRRLQPTGPAPRLDLAVVDELQGLHWRVRSGGTVLARGFADRADAQAWLDAIQALPD